MHVVRRIAAAAAAGAISQQALAQAPLPSPADPSRIDQRVAPQRRGPLAPELPEIRERSPAALPESLKALRITLREIRFEGVTAVPLSRLEARAAGYVGREITGEEIFELARELTALYRSRGYLLSQVIVPPQSLGERRLTLRVVEGYIAEVHLEGDAQLASMLGALGEKIKASRPLHAATLERYLLIAHDLAGMQLRSVLTPSQTVGAADLTLIASTKKLEGYASLDNYGSKYLGPGQFTAALAVNRILGNDQLRVAGVTTGSNAEMNYAQVLYTAVVNSEGLRLGASASVARSKPGEVLEDFETRGRAETYTVSAGYPIWRTRNGSVLGRAVLDYRTNETDVLGTRVVEDEMSALRLGITWLSLDRLDGSNALDLELGQGLGGTKETDPLKSKAGADAKSTRVVVDYERFQPLGRSFGVTFGLAAQYAGDPLLASEQFALGGRRFGRAYEPAEITGDRGWALRLEPAYLAMRYQLYAFYDVGEVRDDTPLPGADATRSLASAGLGTRVSFTRNFSAALEAAKPLTRPVASYVPYGKGDDVRVLGALTARF